MEIMAFVAPVLVLGAPSKVSNRLISRFRNGSVHRKLKWPYPLKYEIKGLETFYEDSFSIMFLETDGKKPILPDME